MPTFYVAIREGSGFDTAIEQDFDTEDNASALEAQANEGVFRKTTTRTKDGRTLFKVEGEDEVVDRYEEFLTNYFPAASRNRAAIARHFNTVRLFKQPAEDEYLFTFFADVTASQSLEYQQLFSNTFEWGYRRASAVTDTVIIGRLPNLFTNDVWGRQWLVRFLDGVDEAYDEATAGAQDSTAANAPAAAAADELAAEEEARLAFIYDWLGDMGMNFYLRARQALRAQPWTEDSLVTTDGGVSKWSLTEGLIRTQRDAGDRPLDYGVPCNDALFSDALDTWWGDECQAYRDFGGPDGIITAQELAAARANASDTQAIDDVLRDMDAMRRGYSFTGLDTFRVFADLGAIYLTDSGYLVTTDRTGGVHFNHEFLAKAAVVAQLEHLRWQLKDSPNDNQKFQATTLRLIDGCLGFAKRLREDPAAALGVGTSTDIGTVIDQAKTTEGALAIVTHKGEMTEFIDVWFSDFDAYVRHVQGEVQASTDSSTPTTLVCEDGAFTGPLDTWDEDECVRYYGTMDKELVSRQWLDELYSSSGGAPGVKDAINHFTKTVRVFTVSVQHDNGSWDSEQLTVDPLLHSVKFWQDDLSTVKLTAEDRAQLEHLIARLEALGAKYAPYVRLIREKMPAEAD